MKDEITLKITRDTPASRSALIYGDGYLVKYFDIKANKSRFAVGIWSHDGFEFPTMKIRTPPKMDHVQGWIHVKGIK